jgi:NAD(P)-dependent dehydrogenase (short-subunit alcohol dehydrogenase family)
MVTGASSGIGRAAALILAEMGATVILVCRDKGRGELVVDEILSKSGDRSADLLIADLASQASIRALAGQFADNYDRLHVLVNNAGVYLTKRHVTVDGIEATFAVNYLAPFLLTNLLLDVLKGSAPARIVNVAGAYHTKGRIDFEDLMGERGYSGRRAISQSKLAEVLFTYELARRLEGTGVTANCLDPGMVATDLIYKDDGLPRLFKYAYSLVKPFLKSPEKGAGTTVHLASSHEVEDTTGSYFIDRKAIKSSPESYDMTTARRLWDVSAALAGLDA